MKPKSPSHISQVVARVRSAWSDMNYAQRRLFEIRTGVAADEVMRQRRTRRTTKELEALYSANEPWLADESWLADELGTSG
jgi:hypothetical protein